MTLAEILLVGLALAGLYRALKPVQRRLEAFFYRLFRSSSRARARSEDGRDTIIDVTDSVKKDNPNE